MQVQSYSSDVVASACAASIVTWLQKALPLGKTLLLVSGGSVAKEVIPELTQLLNYANFPLNNLYVTLVDERFGKPYHPDSNMQLLQDIGFLDFLQSHKAQFIPILRGENNSPEESVEAFSYQLLRLLKAAETRVLGLVGIGSDGHTAGIKPNNNTLEFKRVFQANSIVTAYEAADFSRITLSVGGIFKLTHLVVFVKGEDKQSILKTLAANEAETNQYPMLLLHDHPNVTLFTDTKL